MKRNIFFATILAISISFGVSLPTFADEADNATSQGSGVNAGEVEKPDTASDEGDTVEAPSATDPAIECLEENCPDAETIEHEGTSGEAEVVCASEDEEGCEPSDPNYINQDEGEESQTEPELWPMWISFGALGAMLLLVIIINASNRKRKK